MWRKVIFLVCVGLLVGLTRTTWAVSSVWTNSGSGSSWCTPGNWSSGVPDDLADIAIIDHTSPERGPIIDCAVTVGAIDGPRPTSGQSQVMDVNYSGTVTIGDWNFRNSTGTVTVNINGTVDLSIGGEKWRFGDSGTGTLNISGNPTIVVADELRGADNSDGLFYLNISGGTLDIANILVIGDNGGGQIDVSGGTIIVGEALRLGGKRGVAPITMNVTGGLIDAVEFQLPSNANRAGVVKVNLHGGVIECDSFVHGSLVDDIWTETDDWLLDIEQGTLEIAGDVRDVIDANVAAGQITAYAGDGQVVIALAGPNTVVTALPPDPETATRPHPPIGSENVDPNVVLGWTRGVSADTHNVYFGTSFHDVNDATTDSPEFMGNQGPNTYDPCGAGVPVEYLTTYYWRIDEVSDGTTYKGRVWHFTSGTVIIDPNMLVYYKFDETAGTKAEDSSGYGHHASIYVRNMMPPFWDSNGFDGGCLAFHKTTAGEDEGRGVTSVQAPSGTLSGIKDQITFAVWLNESWNHEDEYGETAHNWVFDAGVGGETGQYHVQAAVPLDDERRVLWRAGDDTNDVLEWDLGGASAKDLEDWHHWAFVKDESQGTMLIYYDGVARESKSGVAATLANISNAPFKIGAATWVNYDYAGYMDEFKVYDRALTAAEISRLYRGGDPGRAWGPYPADRAAGVARDVTLTWRPGDYAVNHNVYFGTNWDDVNDATTASPEYKGPPQPLGANSYDPAGDLDLSTTYFWRIDEVNGPSLWKGKVWRFTTVGFIVVDDMESYNVSDNFIYDTWDDGFNNFTSSQIALEYGVGAIVHGGDRSMKVGYSNMYYPYYSEVDANTNGPVPGNLEIGKDWTLSGMRALTLFFCGQTDNAVEQLYVVLEDSPGDIAVARYGDYGEDINNIQEEEWYQWDVSLPDINAAGVEVADVNKIRIGLGDRDNPVAGGSGYVYLDDIRLYPPRCVPSILKPVADLSENCVVDFEDIRLMADDWLHTDSLPVESPDSGPAAHWELEGDASDSSGNGNHGTEQGTYVYVTGRIGIGAIEFTGDGGKILVPDAPELRPADRLTVTSWVNTSVTPDYQARVVSKGLNADNRDNFGLCINEHDTASFYVRDVNQVYHSAGSNEELSPGEWHHIAGSYDGSSVNCYVNGRLENSDELDEVTLLQDTNSLAIGDMVDGGRAYYGKVDDVQFYNRALSGPEVTYIATEGTGSVPLTSEANLHDSESAGQKAVNLKDYTVLASTWLEEKLWPSF